MPFVAIQPGKQRGVFASYTADKVRVHIQKANKHNVSPVCNIYIGNDIAKKVGFEKSSQIVISRDDLNPLILLLKKSDIYKGTFKLILANPTRKFSNYRLSFSWKLEVLPKMNQVSAFIKYDFLEGGLLLFLPGVTQEDQEIFYRRYKEQE